MVIIYDWKGIRTMCNLRRYRQATDLSVDELANLVGLSSASIYKIETGHRDLPTDCVPNLSKALEAPEMIQDYCHTRCPVGRKYGFVQLNNVDRHPLSVAHSMREEIDEATDALESVEDIQSRRGPFSALYEGQIKQAERAADEVIDIIHNGWVLLEVLAREMGVDLEATFRRHNDKCLQRGYVKTPVAAGVRTKN